MFDEFAQSMATIKKLENRLKIAQVTFVSSSDVTLIFESAFIPANLAKSFLGECQIGDTVLAIEFEGIIYVLSILF